MDLLKREVHRAGKKIELQPREFALLEYLMRNPERGVSKLEIASVRLTNNYLLQVGRSTEDRETILRHFREIFVFVTIPLIILGFTGGIFFPYGRFNPFVI